MSSKSNGSSSRRKGKRGELEAKKTLIANGYKIGDSVLSGISGDDIFAIDRNGKWWSIEVKNTSIIIPKHRKQAMNGARNRLEKMSDARLDVSNFSASNWMLMWHPLGWGISQGVFICFTKDGVFVMQRG